LLGVDSSRIWGVAGRGTQAARAAVRMIIMKKIKDATGKNLMVWISDGSGFQRMTE
jgi:streptomycin 6-kinase